MQTSLLKHASLIGLLCTVFFMPTNKVTAQCCVSPTGMTTSKISSTSATLNWTSIPSAFGYNVQYRITGTGTWTLLNIPPDKVSVTLTNLKSAKVYEYQIQPLCNGFPSCPYSVAQQFITGCSIISGFAAVTESNSIALSWQSVDALSYKVLYGAVGQPLVLLNTTTPNVVLPNLAPNTTYNYQVQPVYAYLLCSFSPLQSAVTKPNCCGVVSPQPTATQQNGGIMRMTWVSVTGATKYNIRYRVVNGVWINITTPNANPTIDLANLLPGTTYEFEVQTVCNNGATNCSFSHTTFNTDCAIPTNIQSGVQSSNSVDISWTPLPGVVGYKLRYRLATGNPNSTWILYPTNTASAQLRYLAASSTYEYQIQGSYPLNLTNCPFSPLQSVITKSNCCGIVSKPTATKQNNGIMQIAWGRVIGATKYQVRYRVAAGVWTNFTTPDDNPTMNLANLLGGTAYECQIQAICNNGSTNCFFSESLIFNTDCALLTNIQSVTKSNTAVISWEPLVGVSSYNVRYSYNNVWQTATTTTTSIQLNNLFPNTNYNCEIRGIYPPNPSSCIFTKTTFLTKPNCCGDPFNINAVATRTTVSISWSSPPGVSSYQFRLKPVNSSTWNQYSVPTIQPLVVNLEHLLEGTTYEYEIQTEMCVNGATNCFFIKKTFTTLACCGKPVLTTLNQGAVWKFLWNYEAGTDDYMLQIMRPNEGWVNYYNHLLASNQATSYYYIRETELVPNTTYNFRIRPYCPNGVDDCWSNVVTFTTPAICTDLFEPNDNFFDLATRRKIGINQVITAPIYPSGDVDNYYIIINNGNPFYRVALTDLPSNCKLEVIDYNWMPTAHYINATPNTNNKIMNLYGGGTSPIRVIVSGILLSDYSPRCYTLTVRHGNYSKMQAQETTSEVEVFPNPTQGTLTLRVQSELSNTEGMIPTVEISDLLGSILEQKTLPEIRPNDNEYNLDLNAYKDGFYMVRVHIGADVTTHKIRVQH
jgi:hypothetical protein